VLILRLPELLDLVDPDKLLDRRLQPLIDELLNGSTSTLNSASATDTSVLQDTTDPVNTATCFPASENIPQVPSHVDHK